MGGQDIFFTLPGTATKRDIEKELERKRNEGRDYNGHQEGYSGDWQTIHDMSYFENKIFNNQEEAEDYCSDNCDKRDGMAVKYKVAGKNFKEDKKYLKTLKLISEQDTEVRDEQKKYIAKCDQLFREMKGAKSKTIGCGECGSSLSRQYLKSKSCPLCETNLLSATAQGQILKAEEKIKAMMSDLTQLKKDLDKIKQDLIDDNGETRWLIFGVAAC